MMEVKKSIICTTLSAILLSGCLYSPAQEKLPDIIQISNPSNSGKSGTGILYSVNRKQQTCNPSISSNPQFPGCMLWLGFDKLVVNVPDEIKTSYDLSSITTHDRLTVTDTSNIVRWHLNRSALENRGEFQCPEWSTHPDYLVCLIGNFTQPYSGYVVRISDKQYIKISDKKLEEFSTPHVWIDNSVNSQTSAGNIRFDSSGFANVEVIRSFFGTNKVKLVYVLPEKLGTLYYIDYSNDSRPVALQKPESRERWYCGSPLISPDGNWVTYHCYQSATQGPQYSSYIQKLDPGSKPQLVADQASDPHWWVDIYNDNQYYIVYTYTSGQYYIESDLFDPELEKSGRSGATVKQRLKGTWKDVPLHIQSLEIDKATIPDTLVKLPFKGGLSADGFFLATAYKYAYLLKLE